MTTRKKKKKSRYFLQFIFKLILFAAIIWAVFTYAISLYRVPGNEMFPNIKTGDLCILYKLDSYYSGEAVCYKENGEIRIGRIVGIEDQEIDFPENGGYLINGYIPSEEITYQTYKDSDSSIQYPLKISKDSVFIMNDFRSDTKDSRIFGEINKQDIVGKVIFILRRRGF